MGALSEHESERKTHQGLPRTLIVRHRRQKATRLLKAAINEYTGGEQIDILKPLGLRGRSTRLTLEYLGFWSFSAVSLIYLPYQN